MESNLKQKKVITILLTPIDIENIKGGESMKSKVKVNFETELPYEVVVVLDGKEDKDFRR